MIKKIIESFLLKIINVDRFLPIQIDITNVCNLRCAHCYHPHHNNINPLSFEQWTKIIDDYFHLINKLHYKPMIAICGGEPPLSEYFNKICTYIYLKDRNTNLIVISNGTLLNNQKLEALKKFSKISFQISIDGPNAEFHDLIRGKQSFQKMMNGIEILKENKIKFHLLSVLSKRSSYWIKDFFELAKNVGASSISFTRFIESGIGENLKISGIDRSLKPLELKLALENIIKNSALYGVRSKTESPLFNLIYPGLGRNGRFWESITIDYQGNFLASSRSRIKIGNVFEKNLETLFLENPIYTKLRKRKIDVCGDCRHFKICGGDRNAAFAAFNNFLGPDPGCWINLKQGEAL